MQDNKSAQKPSGISIWIGTNQISKSYFDGHLDIEPDDITDMIRNAGGTNALRNLTNTCIVLPMINNGIGISPEYRATINQLNALAKKNPEWFHEDMWIQAFQQVIAGLKSTANKPTAPTPQQPQQQAPVVPVQPNNANAFDPPSAPSSSVGQQPSQQQSNTALKDKFNNF